jgi:hypothetical protein
MTDHAAEQEMELEALEAILMDDLTRESSPKITSTDKSNHCQAA